MHTSVIKAIESAPSSDRERLILDYLKSELRKTLHLQVGEAIDDHANVFELGMTSLSLMELKESIEAALSCSFDSSVMFENPTLDGLASHLSRQMASSSSADCSAQEANETHQVVNQMLAFLYGTAATRSKGQ